MISFHFISNSLLIKKKRNKYKRNIKGEIKSYLMLARNRFPNEEKDDGLRVTVPPRIFYGKAREKHKRLFDSYSAFFVLAD